MITIKLADKAIKDKLEISDNAYIVVDNNNVLGFCEFKLNAPEVNIKQAQCDDNQLLDGLIRQTLSYSLDNECSVATFSENVKSKLLLLKILKSECAKQLDILLFFKSLNEC